MKQFLSYFIEQLWGQVKVVLVCVYKLSLVENSWGRVHTHTGETLGFL